ncbi:MAG TPA: SRPBCC family protein [Candidatus Limnocylindria bacterium]|nr:SRPBCC family protein [Candidatus Limnocylindria bacterium]
MGTTSIVIDRPPRAVFARLTDLERAREWAPQMGKFHLEGPLSAGTEMREERRLLGRTVSARWTVTRFETDRAFGLRLRFGPLRGDFEYMLEPVPTGTRLTQTTDLRFSGPLSLLSPIIASEAQKEEDTELVRLKKLLESE